MRHHEETLSTVEPIYVNPNGGSFTVRDDGSITVDAEREGRPAGIARAEQNGNGEWYVAPRTPVEELLAGIWAAVLRVERVGRNDNLFELGGHSLLAVQLLSRVRQVYGVDLSLEVVYSGEFTVAELAKAVGQAVFEAPQEHRRRQYLDLCRGQLDSEGQPVEPLANGSDCRGVLLCEREPNLTLRRAMEKERDRGIGRQFRQR